MWIHKFRAGSFGPLSLFWAIGLICGLLFHETIIYRIKGTRGGPAWCLDTFARFLDY